MFFNNAPKRPMIRPPMQPAPQPVRPPFTSAFGQPIARAPQQPQPVGLPGMMGGFGQPIARAPQPTQGPSAFSGMFGNSGFGQPISPIPQGNPVTPPPMQGPSAFSGMFGNGGFGQPQQPFTSAFGQPIFRAPQQPTQLPTQSPFLGGFGGGQPMAAPQQPQPATGLAGLGTMSPEQIAQLQNNMGPQTLPANTNQELAKMSPGYANNNTQNMTGGLSSLGLS